MTQSFRLLVAFRLLCCLATLTVSLRAQEYEKVVSFTDLYNDVASGGDNIGAYVNSMLEGPDGNIYGTTQFTDGGAPREGVSPSGPGTIFKMTPDGLLSTLFSFSNDPLDPKGARGSIETLAVDGRFYGLTLTGGAYGHGSVFRITRNGDFTIMRSFTGTTGIARGSHPVIMFQAPDRNFYGVTSKGGINDFGTVFRMNSQGAIESLVDFTGAAGDSPGGYPNNLLLGADGLLYGTTSQGGGTGNGTLFRVSITGDFQMIAEFTGSDGSRPGSQPRSLIEPMPGVLVGTTASGGSGGGGVLFRVTPGGTWGTIVDFNGSNGRTPVLDLVSNPDGIVFGLTDSAGAHGDGTVFRYDPNGQFGTIHNFINHRQVWWMDFEVPKMSLLALRDGSLIGSTGPENGDSVGTSGAVFHMTPSGQYSEIAEFYYDDDDNLTNGLDPRCMLQTSDGSVFGYFHLGGFELNPADGTIFRVPQSMPALNHILQFGKPRRQYIPAQVMCGLAQANDGLFYATSHGGGNENLGSVFSTSFAGDVRLLHSFRGEVFSTNQQRDGLHPKDALAINGAGDLFGVTSFLQIGPYYYQNPLIFGISPEGVMHWNHSLDRISYNSYMSISPPGGAPVLNPDGLMFRPAYSRTLTRFDSNGNVSYLENFLPAVPYESSGPILADGYNLYGTFSSGGDYGDGMIYRTHSVTGGPQVLASFQNRNTFNISNSWTNQSITPRNASSDSSFAISFTMMADYANIDGVVGLASGLADSYDDLACSVRMFTNGIIEVRNGSLYQATGINYQSGRNYRITLLVNLAAKTYSTLVDGVEVANGCSFRTQQAGLESIDNVGMICSAGNLTVSDISGAILPLQGRKPLARLTMSSDGYFYGTASQGGAHGQGTVFRMTPEGALAKLVDFTGADGPFKGSQPASALLEHQGWFYGTTNSGGEANLGTVFRISPDGNTYESLFDFMDDNLDSVPMGDLTLGSDGNLYGTTHGSGTGRGSVFRLVLPGPPVIYSMPAEMSGNTTVQLQTKINPRGNTSAVWLEYGTDGVTFLSQPLISALGNWRTFDLGHTLRDLAPGTTYVYRFRAVYAGGSIVGPPGYFDTIGPPVVLAENPSGVSRNAAVLHGTVRAGNAISFLSFEYGTDGNTFPFAVNPTPALANGSNEIAVSAAINLEAGTTYYYRLTANNSAGTSVSGVRSFTTLADPLVTVGGSFALSTTSVRVEGTVNARGSEGVNVAFEFGIGGTVLVTVPATPAVVGGVFDTPVIAVLTNLNQGTEYFYRIKATAPGLDGESEKATFTMNVLSGFAQDFPDSPPQSQGFIIVNLTPPGVGGWRFTGEQVWRAPGIPVGGLTTSDRVVEFMPVNSYIQPPPEPVSIISGGVPTYLNLAYDSSGQGGSGGLTVTLKPADLADINLPEAERAQWRLFKLGTNTDPWLNSGASLLGLLPGNYLIECKPVAGRTTPPPSAVMVEDGVTSARTIVYYLKDPQTGAYPLLLPFETVSTSTNLPYGYVGQIRSDAGSGSGFVVRSRVVLTAGHAIFDEETLSTVTGLQWLLQRDSVSHEPKPLIPRGAHLLDDYAAARQAPGAVPGSGTPESQNRDAAALFFGQDAGRGGFSGYLASDAVENEFLESPALKMLVGYPVSGEGYVSGRMYATAAMNAGFTRVPTLDEFGNPFRTYRTSDIRGSGGMSGGPLCVQFEGGIYYPAAIYLGGSNETVVRAIDSKVIDIINNAEVSSVAGDNNTGGGITFSSFTTFNTSTYPYGALRVTIKPDAAQSARWRINSGLWRNSGYQQALLVSGSPYTLEFETPSGFSVPTAQSVEIKSGKIRDITFTYGQTLTAMESWRMTHFGTPSNAGDAADNADPDGDGSVNRSEYAADTNPKSALDLFRIQTMERTTGSFTVTAAGKKDRRYTLQRSASLAGGSWSNVASIGPLPANQSSVPLTDPNPLISSGFYRIEVTAP